MNDDQPAAQVEALPVADEHVLEIVMRFPSKIDALAALALIQIVFPGQPDAALIALAARYDADQAVQP